MTKLQLIICSLFISSICFSQTVEKPKLNEKVRFITDSINGVYIPKDLEDCFKQINTFWADSTKTKLKQLTEDDFSAKLHFGFGMWMRNNWQLWGGSRLSKFFNEKGIFHPDDMSGIILHSYHRSLNNTEIDLEKQIQYYKDYWENSKKEQLARKEDKFSHYKVNDTIQFVYRKGFVSESQEKKYDDDLCNAKGIVTELNHKDFLVKVKVIETCDEKGIVYYDNDGSRIYNPKTREWKNPKRRIIKRIKKGKEIWFDYEDWEPK